MVRHEIGHYVWFLMPKTLQEEYARLASTATTTRYGRTNVLENFAERCAFLLALIASGSGQLKNPRNLAINRFMLKHVLAGDARKAYAISWDERKHPRVPKGMKRGGKFIEKPGDEQLEMFPQPPSSAVLLAGRATFAEAAQRVYDDWDENEDEYAGGGICHLIAEEIADELNGKGIDADTVDNGGMGEQHVWVVAKVSDGVFLVDIPPNVYERGGGYTWTKVPGVRFEASDVIVDRIDADPAKFDDYVGYAVDPDFERKHPRGPKGTPAGGDFIEKPDSFEGKSYDEVRRIVSHLSPQDQARCLADHGDDSNVVTAVAYYGATSDLRLKAGSALQQFPNDYDDWQRQSLDAWAMAGKDKFLSRFYSNHAGDARGIFTAQMQRAMAEVGPNTGASALHFFTEGVAVPPPNPMIVGWLTEEYARTQAVLASAPETFHLFRGTDQRRGLAMESWTPLKRNAGKFARRLGRGGDVREADVPKALIFATHETIPGWDESAVKGKQEYIVLGAALASSLRYALDPAFETKHPRGPKGTPAGGDFIEKPDAYDVAEGVLEIENRNTGGFKKATVLSGYAAHVAHVLDPTWDLVVAVVSPTWESAAATNDSDVLHEDLLDIITDKVAMRDDYAHVFFDREMVRPELRIVPPHAPNAAVERRLLERTLAWTEAAFKGSRRNWAVRVHWQYPENLDVDRGYATDPAFETKHPRGGKGTKQGGKFVPKHARLHDLPQIFSKISEAGLPAAGPDEVYAARTLSRDELRDFFRDPKSNLGSYFWGARDVSTALREIEAYHKSGNLILLALPKKDQGDPRLNLNRLDRDHGEELHGVVGREDVAALIDPQTGKMLRMGRWRTGGHPAAKFSVAWTDAPTKDPAFERLHPRGPKGTPVGGKFIEKPGSGASARALALSMLDRVREARNAGQFLKIGGDYAVKGLGFVWGVSRAANTTDVSVKDAIETEFDTEVGRLWALHDTALDAEGVDVRIEATRELVHDYNRFLDRWTPAVPLAHVQIKGAGSNTHEEALMQTHRYLSALSGGDLSRAYAYAVDPEFERKHPRGPKGTPAGGDFIKKPGGTATQQTSSQWYKSLSDAERTLMDNWVTGQSFMDDVHAAEESGQPLPPDVEAFHRAVDAAPEMPGAVYRGFGGLDDEQLNALLDSKVITLRETSSFTASDRLATKFAIKQTFEDEAFVIMRVEDGHGAHDVSAANRYGEREAILLPGTRLQKVGPSEEVEIEGKYGYRVVVRRLQ